MAEMQSRRMQCYYGRRKQGLLPQALHLCSKGHSRHGNWCSASSTSESCELWPGGPVFGRRVWKSTGRIGAVQRSLAAKEEGRGTSSASPKIPRTACSVPCGWMLRESYQQGHVFQSFREEAAGSHRRVRQQASRAVFSGARSAEREGAALSRWLYARMGPARTPSCSDQWPDSRAPARDGAASRTLSRGVGDRSPQGWKSFEQPHRELRASGWQSQEQAGQAYRPWASPGPCIRRVDSSSGSFAAVRSSRNSSATIRGLA